MKKEEKIQIRIQKEFKEELKMHAENQNEPMSIYILKSIRERINKENVFIIFLLTQGRLFLKKNLL